MGRTTQEGINFLKQEEGCRLKMYLDSAGLPSIGIGHCLTKDELRSGKIMCLSVDWHTGLTEVQVEELLRRDLFEAEQAVDTNVRVALTAPQYHALVSFAFNVGKDAFAQSTLVKQLNNKQYDAVPTQMRRWIYSGGKRDPILVARREREIELWKKGS